MTSTSVRGWGRTLFRATLIGTVLQLLLAVFGHYDARIANLFAAGGMFLSLVAGLLFGLWSGPLARTGAIAGGAVAGAVCALIGIVESYLPQGRAGLGDRLRPVQLGRHGRRRRVPRTAREGEDINSLALP